MKISVAMCTYNGAQYLQGQLNSIAAQTRSPDELVVCDDCSTDSTRDLLRSFEASASFPVRLHFNEHNLRVVKNFEKAINLCEGDIIATCDQDDFWRPQKLMRVEDAFRTSPKVGLVFSDLEVVDETLQPLGRRAWQSKWVDFGVEEQELCNKGRALDVLLTRNIVTGAAMAIRSEFKNLITPFPNDFEYLIHDYWIALVISAVADVIAIDEPLVEYREHSNQEMGLVPPTMVGTPKEYRAWRRKTYKTTPYLLELLLDRLNTGVHKLKHRRAMRELESRLAYERARVNLSSSKYLQRAPQALLELLRRRYHRFHPPLSSGWHEAAQDLLPYKVLELFDERKYQQ